MSHTGSYIYIYIIPSYRLVAFKVIELDFTDFDINTSRINVKISKNITIAVIGRKYDTNHNDYHTPRV